MSDKNLRLQVVLNAVDKLTRPLKNALAGSKELASGIRQTRDQLKRLNDAGSQLKSFDQLSQSLNRTSNELDQARLRAQMMTRELAALESPTKNRRRRLRRNGAPYHARTKAAAGNAADGGNRGGAVPPWHLCGRRCP